MKGVAYQAHSDRPLDGPRTECMAEVLFEMTRYNFREIPVCLVDDFLSALMLAMNALPDGEHRKYWVALIGRRLADSHGKASPAEMIAAIADRLADEKESWEEEKRVLYPVLP